MMLEPGKIVIKSHITQAFVKSIFDASENQLIRGAVSIT
jgi:hypothetical protein